MAGRAIRLLVVEAEPGARRALCDLARADGLRADAAASVAELEPWLGASAGEARCVLVALALPDADVVRVLAVAGAAQPPAPVIVLRGDEAAEKAVTAWTAGAETCLQRSKLGEGTLRGAADRAVGAAATAGASGPVSTEDTRPLRVMQTTCHDLRNPLSAMMINANILLREETLADERRMKVANRILASATRMNRMIDDLADYATAAQGKVIPVRPTDTDLGSIASEALREARVAHPGRNLVLEQRGDLRGHWDPGRLRQVMHSLLGSALKRGRPGTIVVVGCAEIIAPPEVEIGLDYRLDPEAPALGNLGECDAACAPDGEEASLFVARRIADAHHGSLTVSATDGIGPRFLMRLPKRAPTPGPKPA